MVRSKLPANTVIEQLAMRRSYSQIASDMSDLTGIPVTRNVIAGMARDLKAGKLKRLQRPTTYVYGTDDTGEFPVYSGHPQLDGDFVVIADTHIPKTDYDLLERVPLVARYYGIKRLLIAGDFYDGDSRHHKNRGVPISLSKQIKWGRKALHFLFEYFDEIHMIPGNHDEWFIIDTNHELEWSDLGHMVQPDNAKDMQMYCYDRVHIFSGGREVVVPHQANAAKNPLTVPDNLAQQFQAAVICPHQHRTAKGLDSNNRYQIASIGGLHNQDMFDYKQLKTSTYPPMHQGFAVIDDGYIEVIGNEVYTNWKRFTGV